jgi:hypothetical protein
MATDVGRAAARHAQQQYVDSLLDELERQRRQLYRLKAGGALPAGLRDVKRDLKAVQRRLAHAVDGAAR